MANGIEAVAQQEEGLGQGGLLGGAQGAQEAALLVENGAQALHSDAQSLLLQAAVFAQRLQGLDGRVQLRRVGAGAGVELPPDLVIGAGAGFGVSLAQLGLGGVQAPHPLGDAGLQLGQQRELVGVEIHTLQPEEGAHPLQPGGVPDPGSAA